MVQRMFTTFFAHHRFHFDIKSLPDTESIPAKDRDKEESIDFCLFDSQKYYI